MSNAEKFNRVELQRQLDQRQGRAQAMLGGWQSAIEDAIALVGCLCGGTELVIARHAQAAKYHMSTAQRIIQNILERDEDV